MADEEENEASSQPPSSPRGPTPWSSFHSSLKLPARVPGTPVRQQPTAIPALTLKPPSQASKVPEIVQEMKQHFSTLDFLIEYKLLFLHCPKGIYVLPSSKSLHEWHGVIFVRSGPYQSGVFRFTIYIPDGFPHLQPMVRFHSRVAHPYVHVSNGALNLLRGLPPWEPNVHHLWHVVEFIADCFYKEETWAETDQEVFRADAKTCAQESNANLYNPDIGEDGNLVRFCVMKEDSFQKALATLVDGGLPDPADQPRPSILANVKDQVKQFWDRMAIT